MQNIFMISMISVLMGQFYISPEGTDFRMTLAVFFMSLFLVYFEHYNAMLITLSVGLSTFLFRSVVYALGSGVPFFEAASIYAPVLSYYVLFGALFIALSVRRYFHQPFHFFIALWVCDTIPNLFEAFLRRAWLTVPFDRLVMTIAAVGAMRTIMVLFSFYLGRYYIGKSKRDEREKSYRELILFISRLKTELFLLKKSRQDIEATMALAHDVYETVDEEALRGPLLKIAKDIHEIKKDYLRVIAGMDAIFSRDTEKKTHEHRGDFDHRHGQCGASGRAAGDEDPGLFLLRSVLHDRGFLSPDLDFEQSDGQQSRGHGQLRLSRDCISGGQGPCPPGGARLRIGNRPRQGGTDL